MNELDGLTLDGFNKNPGAEPYRKAALQEEGQ